MSACLRESFIFPSDNNAVKEALLDRVALLHRGEDHDRVLALTLIELNSPSQWTPYQPLNSPK